MAQGRSAKNISMISLIRTSRLSIKNFLPAGARRPRKLGRCDTDGSGSDTERIQGLCCSKCREQLGIPSSASTGIGTIPGLAELGTNFIKG